MTASVTIDLSVEPQSKHFEQMKLAAMGLTDDAKSVEVACSPESPKKITASFSVPDARQIDVVERIRRGFLQVENYCYLSIGFGPRGRGTRRTRHSVE